MASVPANLFYWINDKLRLTIGSTDEKFEKKTRRKANVPYNNVSDLQKDLIELGYLKAGSDDGNFQAGTARAVKRFQRHALRKFRWDGMTKSISTGWVGTATGICDPSTAKEVRVWIDKKFRLPVGVFSITDIDGGKMREDAAPVWTKAITDATAAGATLLPDTTDTSKYYGDTLRGWSGGFASTGGNSKLSFHYTGRAVDVSQALPGGSKQRWWVEKEVVGTQTFWRVWCKTDKQDGTQGTQIAKNTKKFYVFFNNTEGWIPEAYYLDITAFLSAVNFERIPAHDNYTSNSKGFEWWHFQYSADIQDTFLDEMELIGVTEAQLKTAGWTEADMDKAPG